MAAFNWVLIKGLCPTCVKTSDIICQCHVASSYDGFGGERFHDHKYRLREKMRWWPEGHPNYPRWKDGGVTITANSHRVKECCYAECSKCQSELYAVIDF